MEHVTDLKIISKTLRLLQWNYSHGAVSYYRKTWERYNFYYNRSFRKHFLSRYNLVRPSNCLAFMYLACRLQYLRYFNRLRYTDVLRRKSEWCCKCCRLGSLQTIMPYFEKVVIRIIINRCISRCVAVFLLVVFSNYCTHKLKIFKIFIAVYYYYFVPIALALCACQGSSWRPFFSYIPSTSSTFSIYFLILTIVTDFHHLNTSNVFFFSFFYH